MPVERRCPPSLSQSVRGRGAKRTQGMSPGRWCEWQNPPSTGETLAAAIIPSPSMGEGQGEGERGQKGGDATPDTHSPHSFNP